MKLYNAPAPNGNRVSIFIAEKGIDIPVEPVDVLKGATRTTEFLAINSFGQIPVLELDNGQYLTESMAICRYLEGLYPEPALLGQSLEEQAFVEMWNRRIELKIFRAIGDVGLHEFELFKDQIEQMPDYAKSQRTAFVNHLIWLDKALADGGPYVAGEKFSVADITLIAALLVAGFAGVKIPSNFEHIKKWTAAIKARPSVPQLPI